MLWILFGWLVSRRIGGPGGWLRRQSRSVLSLLGVFGFMGGLVVLVIGLRIASALGGVKNGILTMPAWLVISVVGSVFVACQVIGAMSMLSLSVQTETKKSP